MGLGHKTDHRDYLQWKLELARGMGFYTSRIKDFERLASFGMQKFSNAYVGFGDYRYSATDLETLISNLDDLGLLLWWLDDGVLSISSRDNGSTGRFGYLSTEKYCLEDNELISNLLSRFFNIKTSINKYTGAKRFGSKIYYRQYFSASSMRDLIDIVRPFIVEVPECMLYKLNMKYVTNKLKISESYTRLYNF